MRARARARPTRGRLEQEEGLARGGKQRLADLRGRGRARQRSPAVADVVVVPLHQRRDAGGQRGEIRRRIDRGIAGEEALAQMAAQRVRLGRGERLGILLGPVVAGGMALGDLVGIDLVAAMDQRGEGRLGMGGAQPRPHRIALGALALHVAGLLAVAGDIGQPQIALGEARDGEVPPLPAVAAPGPRQHEAGAPDVLMAVALHLRSPAAAANQLFQPRLLGQERRIFRGLRRQRVDEGRRRAFGEGRQRQRGIAARRVPLDAARNPARRQDARLHVMHIGEESPGIGDLQLRPVCLAARGGRHGLQTGRVIASLRKPVSAGSTS